MALAGATLSALTAQIADDLNRSDLTAEIATAVEEAIELYQFENWYSTQKRLDPFISTVTGVNRYNVPSDLQTPDQLLITISGNFTYPLILKSEEELNRLDIQSNPRVLGQPYWYSWFAQQFRLYPTPDNVYPLIAVYDANLASPVNPTDSNFWTTDAESLIRYSAEAILWETVLSGADFSVQRAEGARRRAAERFVKLKAKTLLQTRPGQVRARYF